VRRDEPDRSFADGVGIRRLAIRVRSNEVEWPLESWLAKTVRHGGKA
jgi:hypothetical protein